MTQHELIGGPQDPAEVTQQLGGMATMAETQTEAQKGYLSPEFVNEREVFYKERTGAIYLGCGDDRPPTAASSTALAATHPEAMSVNEGYSSIYGGLAGVAKNVIVTGVAQYGPSFITTVDGFTGAMDTLISYSRADSSDKAIIPTLHSAEGNEQSADNISHTEENQATGCAYAGGVGATGVLLVDPANAHIRDVARCDQEAVFGQDDEAVDALLKGQKFFVDTYGADFAVNRAQYIAYDTPTETRKAVAMMILAGSHTHAKTSGVISNFDLDKIGDATAAHQQGKDFYREDIAIAAELALRAFPELKLDPELLLRSFQLDSTPVRAVLVAHDSDASLQGKLDPQELPMGVRGNVRRAIKELQNL
jgi:hypothetical protein